MALYLLYFNVSLGRVGDSLQALDDFKPSAWRSQVPRITKATALYSGDNDLHEAAVESHKAHNRIHGYGMKILRDKIINTQLSQPAYLLSLVVAELAKPAEARTEWLMWTSPETVILNPQIPLEIFLPPPDFKHTHFIGTHDANGFCGGVFLLRIHEWSVQMLLEVLAPPRKAGVDLSKHTDSKAMENTLADEHFRIAVVYQPHSWFNAYELDIRNFEGKHGDLLVHFHGLDGDTWAAMAQTFKRLKTEKRLWSVPLQKTKYQQDVATYWERMRKSRDLIAEADGRAPDEAVKGARDRLSWIRDYKCDSESEMKSAIAWLETALGEKEGKDEV